MTLKSSLFWMALSQAGGFVLQFGGSVILARFLTPYEMGIYAVAAAVVGLLSIVQGLGLQSLIVREDELTSEIAASAFTINSLIAVGLSLAIAGFSVLGGAFLGDEGVRNVLLVLAINPLFGIVEFLPSANLERRGQFKILSLVNTLSNLATTTFTIGLAVLGFTYMSIAYGGWAGALVNVTILNIVGRQHVGFRVGFAAWRRIASFGMQMLAVAGITSLSQRLSDVALGRLQGLGALGLYSRASSLNGLLWNNIHLVIGRVVFVDFAELRRQGISLRERYLSTVAIITATLWPAFSGLALLSGPFIVTLYGEKWLPASRPLALLAIASILQVAITMTWELFAATGELKAQTRIEFIRATLALATFITGCFFGLTAAAGARVIDALVAIYMYRPHLNRMTDTSTADFLPIYARSALLTVLATAPAALLMGFNRMSAHTPLPLVAASIVLGVVFWGVGLVWMSHPLASETASVIRRFWGRSRLTTDSSVFDGAGELLDVAERKAREAAGGL